MKKKVTVLVGALAIGTMVGLGFSQSDQDAQASENQQASVSSDDISSQVNEQYEGEITELELEDENNQLYYEVEVTNDNEEYDLKVDAETGEILKENVEKFHLETTGEEPNEHSSVDSAQWIGNQRAKEIALNEFSGTIVEFELDDDDDRYVYEIEIKDGENEAEFEIDAVTGSILEMEIEVEDD